MTLYASVARYNSSPVSWPMSAESNGTRAGPQQLELNRLQEERPPCGYNLPMSAIVDDKISIIYTKILILPFTYMYNIT